MSSSEVENIVITRSARRLRWGVFAMMAVVALLYGAARFGLRLGNWHVDSANEDVWSPLIGDISLALLLVALVRLTQMLARIAAGERFSGAVIRHFRGFAFWLLAMALFGLLAPLAPQFLAMAKGEHYLSFTLDFRVVLTALITLLLFLIARLLEHARRIDEEVREFV